MSGLLSRMIARVQTGRTDVMPRRAARYEDDATAPFAGQLDAEEAAPRPTGPEGHAVSPRAAADVAAPTPRAEPAAAAVSAPSRASERPDPSATAQAVVVRELQRITEAMERRVEILAPPVADPSAPPAPARDAPLSAEPLTPRRADASLPAWPPEAPEPQAQPMRAAAPAEPSISLEIGRIEIISPAPPARAPAPARRGPRLDLDGYLAARRRGER